MGGLLTLPSFLKVFPEINVTAAPVEQQEHVSVIQGKKTNCQTWTLLTAWQELQLRLIMLVSMRISS